MPLEFKPLRGKHLRYIDVQDAQKDDMAFVLNPEINNMIDKAFGISAWVGNRCIGAAGIMHLYPHRGMGWALLSRHCRGYMGPIVRKTRFFIQNDPTPRIETTVRADFEAGLRFAKLVGLEQETGILRKYGSRGEDEYIFARIR